MVIDHSHRLHEGVTDCRADEFESAPKQIFAHGVGFRRSGRDLLQGLTGIADGLSTHEAPEVGVEAAEFLLHRQECFGVTNGRRDLEPIAHNAWVGKQIGDFARVVARDLPGVEVVEDTAVVLTLVQNGGPA